MEQVGFLILMNGMTRDDYIEMAKALGKDSDVGEAYDKAVAATGASLEFIEHWKEDYPEVKYNNQGYSNSSHYKCVVAGFWQNKGGSVEDMIKWTGLSKETLLELKEEYLIDEKPRKKKRSD